MESCSCLCRKYVKVMNSLVIMFGTILAIAALGLYFANPLKEVSELGKEMGAVKGASYLGAGLGICGVCLMLAGCFGYRYAVSRNPCSGQIYLCLLVFVLIVTLIMTGTFYLATSKQLKAMDVLSAEKLDKIDATKDKATITLFTASFDTFHKEFVKDECTWGKPEPKPKEEATELVSFVRRLPDLLPGQEQCMDGAVVKCKKLERLGTLLTSYCYAQEGHNNTDNCHECIKNMREHVLEEKSKICAAHVHREYFRTCEGAFVDANSVFCRCMSRARSTLSKWAPAVTKGLLVVCCVELVLALSVCWLIKAAPGPSGEDENNEDTVVQMASRRNQPVYEDFQCPMASGPGEKVQVQASDGSVLEVVVPDGVYGGQMFSVDVSGARGL